MAHHKPSQAFLYNDTYDAAVKSLVKSSQTCVQLSRQPVVKEVLGDISNLVQAEKKDDADGAQKHGDDEDDDHLPGKDDACNPDDVIEVTLKVQKSKTAGDVPETKTIHIGNLSDARRDAVLRGKKMVAGLLSSHVQFVDRSVSDLQAAIAGTGAGRVKGECKGKSMSYVAVVFASATFGESDSRPRYRMPPLNPDTVRQLLEAARGRFDTPADTERELDEGDMFLLFDGGRPGVEGSLLAFFSTLKKARRSVHLMKDPSSVEGRMERLKNAFAAFNCMETVHVITRTPIKDVGRKHRHYPGSLISNVLGPIVLTPYSDSWNLRFGDKKLLYGKGIIRVGGKLQDVDVDEEDDPQAEQDNKQVKRTDDTVEPTLFHALPYLMWEDLAMTMGWCAVVDLTASDGMLALACVKNGLPYCGVTFTPRHTELLQARLTKLVTEACCTEGDPLYDASFAKALLGGGNKRGHAHDSSDDDGAKKPKGKAKAKASNTNTEDGKGKDPKDAKDSKDAKDPKPKDSKPKDPKPKRVRTKSSSDKEKAKSKKSKKGKPIDPFFSSESGSSERESSASTGSAKS